MEAGVQLDLKRTTFLDNEAIQSGGAMGFTSNATLSGLTILKNYANTTGRDIYIPETATGFVDCKDGLFPNLFCDGMDGIEASIVHTNCATAGKASGLRCNVG